MRDNRSRRAREESIKIGEGTANAVDEAAAEEIDEAVVAGRGK